MNEIPKIQRIVSVFWPSFIVAGIATILFFTAFDPQEFLINTRFQNSSRLGSYTVGFFLFWLIGAASSALTCYFRKECHPDNVTDTSVDTVRK